MTATAMSTSEPTEAETALLERCIESIQSMGDASTAVVTANEHTNATVNSVASQLSQKGWAVEILPRDADEPPQLIISRPSANPAPSPAPKPNALQEQAAADALSKWTAFESAQQARADTSDAPPAQVTFTASKAAIIGGLVLIAVFATVWHFYISPRKQLAELAQETCDDLEGSNMFVAGATLGSAVRKAERLGFTGPELGEGMRKKCPSIIRQIENFASH